jgi:hypothetical protein
MIIHPKSKRKMHCASHSIRVLDHVRDTFKNEKDVQRFQAFLETIPNRQELCRVDDLFTECSRVECIHCFRRVSGVLKSLVDEGVATSILGDDPLKSIAECTQTDNITQSPGFLATVYDRINMMPSFVPVGPRYTLDMFLRNMKVLLDRADGLRADGKDVDVLETVIDEQNQILGMLADCVSEFVTSVYKFEFVRPFKDVHKLVHAFVALFEVLCTTLFDACQKVRERFHRTGVPSIVGVNMPGYLEKFKEDVDEKTYKGALLSVHILNIQRFGSLQSFYSLACDQVVVLEHEFAHEMTSKFKYVDQMDFALPYKDMPIKMVLLAHLELALGPLNVRNTKAEFTEGRYPSVMQELGMLELRCSKIQEGHLECWTRTKDRATVQLVPEDFPMTPVFQKDIDAVLKKHQMTTSGAQFTKEAALAIPRIDAMLATDPLGAMRQRAVLRMTGLRALTDLVFATMKVTGLVTFLHDYFPVLQEYVCGTDTHVQVFVRSLVVDAHVRALVAEYKKYEQEQALDEILKLECVQTSEKTLRPKQKKMSQKKKPEPVRTTAVAAAPSARDFAEPVQPEPLDEDSGGEWEQVQSKKKSSVNNKGTFIIYAAATTNRSRRTQTQKTHSASTYYYNTHPTAPPATTRTATDGRTRRNKHLDRVRNRPEVVCVEQNPERAVEPERGPDPVEVVAPCEPEREPEQPVGVPCEPEREPQFDLDGCDPPSTGSIETPVAPDPKPAPAEITSENPEIHSEKPKSQRRRGGGRRNKSALGEATPGLTGPFGIQMTPIDPLVLASYAASQVAQPVPLVHHTVAVPARMFGGVLSSDYASVPFMTFPRVYL